MLVNTNTHGLLFLTSLRLLFLAPPATLSPSAPSSSVSSSPPPRLAPLSLGSVFLAVIDRVSKPVMLADDAALCYAAMEFMGRDQ